MFREWRIPVVLFSLFLGACSEPEHRVFIPKDKNFSIILPCKPQLRSEVQTYKDYIIQSKIYRCHGLDYAYVITYSEYPVDIYKEYSAEELVADVVKRVEFQDPPFEFISKQNIMINGVKATQINSRLLSPRALYKTVIFYSGDGIYQVAYGAKPEKFENPQADAFYASMQLAGK